jgi:uncharacterized membrane protein
MSILRHWKIVLCIGAIFVVGAITGGALTLKAVHTTILRTVVRNGLFGDWPNSTMKRLQARLKLRPEQVQKIRPILEDTGKELKGTTREAFGQIVSITTRNNEMVAQELDPEQRRIFDQMNEETRRYFLQLQRRSEK